MSKNILLLSALSVLGACAYALDGNIQDLTVLTPGAEDAVCYVYVDDLRYEFFPPQTVNIYNSKEDLVIDCLAPGNRRKKVVIEPEINKKVAGNVATGVVPGATWDYTSGAMFKYPIVVEVDFTGMAVSPEPLPAQNNPDIKQPEEYDLEEFSPGSPRLNSDRYAPTLEIRKRTRGNGSSVVSKPITTAPGAQDKGDLQSVPAAESSIDPGVTPSGKGPVPLYPGE